MGERVRTTETEGPRHRAAVARLLLPWLLCSLVAGACRSPDTDTYAVVPPPPTIVPQPQGDASAGGPFVVAENGDHVVVQVFYGTDRKPTFDGTDPKRRGSLRPAENYSPAEYYSGEIRGDDEIEYGECRVSIPESHERGEVEELSWWQKAARKRWALAHLIWKTGPGKHVALLSVDPLSETAMLAQMERRLRESDDKSLLVFIHGYNNTFEDAARRTAQIAYDVDFPGVVAMYSWPSNGQLLGYSADEDEIDLTWPHLKEFLATLVDSNQFHQVHVIAHSMGNRALSMALKELAEERPEEKMFDQVVLAAPDINVRVFERDAKAIAEPAKHVTLYVSPDDKSLMGSHILHGKYPRVRTEIVVKPPIKTVDASAVAGGALSFGHSYIGNSPRLLEDLAAVLRGRVKFEWRAKLQKAAGVYWRLREAVATTPAAR